MKKLILASQSPSRKKILSDMGYLFESVPSEFEERFDMKKTPQENAVLLSEGKAQAVFDRLSPEEQKNTVVVGMDTIAIDANGKLLEKPRNKKDAENMVKTRSGKKEVFLSGVCFISGDKKFSSYEETALFWRNISAHQREYLLSSGEWKGKCGGVAIEGKSGLFVEKISGNYANVMGIPINEFEKGVSMFFSY